MRIVFWSFACLALGISAFAADKKSEKTNRQPTAAEPTKVIYGTSELQEWGNETGVYIGGPVGQKLYDKLEARPKKDPDDGETIKAAGNIRCKSDDDGDASCVIFLEKNGKTGRIKAAH